MTRQISENGLKFIEGWEALRLTGYMPTPNDVPTAGWGHTGPEVKIGQQYTRGQAVAWLDHDLDIAEEEVNRACPNLTQNQFDACVSLTHNIGVGGFEHSTVHRMIDSGQILAASDAFLLWNKQAGQILDGLTNRRKAERTLFLTPDPIA